MTKGSLIRVVAGLGLIVALLAIWQGLVDLLSIKAYTLPSPSRIATVLVQQWHLLWTNSLVTVEEVLIGYAIAVIVGVPLALFISLSRYARTTLSPLLVGLQIVPKVAVAPLFVVWFGFGIDAKVLMTLLIAFFPVLIEAMTGFMSETIEMEELASVMGLSRWARFWTLRLPNALPSIFAGLKVGLTFAVIGAIVGEFVGANSGIGYVIQLANGNLETPLLFAGVVTITLWGLALYGAMAAIEHVAMPWHVSRRLRG